MRTRLALSLAVAASLVSALLSAPAFAADGDSGFAGDINIKVGQKKLHENDFKAPGVDLSSQTGFGLLSSWGMKNWPVMIAFDVDSMSGSKSGIKVSEMEISLGARKGFMLSSMPIIPYVGAGVSYGSGTQKFAGSSNTLTGYGIWIDGGAQYVIAQHFGVGLDIKYDSCPVSKKISGTTVKADIGGLFPALFVGYMF